MSMSLGIDSTAIITWEEFYDFLQGPMQAAGLQIISSSPEIKRVYMQQTDPEVEYYIDLYNRGDEPTDYTINTAASESNLPIETVISLIIHSPLRGNGTGELDQALLRVLCVFAEKWPIVVDNDGVGEGWTYYTKEDLYYRLREGLLLFPH